MATRRMFSSRITESTRFVKMPASSQNLYFHLGMKADDDGVVEAYPVMCVIGATEDDLRVLVGKQFVTVLNEDLVVFLNDWTENNSIRADRKVDSIYKNLLIQMVPDIELKEPKKRSNSRKEIVCQSNDRQVTDKCQPNVGIGKDRIGKDRISKDRNTLCPELKKTPQDQSGIKLPLVDKTEYDVTLSKIEKWSAAYPAVDIRQELMKMIVWLEANPDRRKTRRGVERFICTWLSREQDKGGTLRNGNKQQEIRQQKPQRKDAFIGEF